jgi:hypothetical protein
MCVCVCVCVCMCVCVCVCVCMCVCEDAAILNVIFLIRLYITLNIVTDFILPIFRLHVLPTTHSVRTALTGPLLMLSTLRPVWRCCCAMRDTG